MRAFKFAALLLVALEVPAAFAQVNDTYVIAAAGNAAGAYGTRWKSQFSLFNPQPYELVVSVTYIPTGGAPGTEVLIRVPPNAVAFSNNVLQELFGVSDGTGALLVATFPTDNPTVPNNIISRAFLVTTDTYNDAPIGTFGQTIPGIWTGLQDFATDGISAVAHGIRNLSGQGWRANVGAVNLGRGIVTMRLNVYDRNGITIAKNIPFTIPPLAHFQDRLPVQVDAGSIEFFIDDPQAHNPQNAAVVFPYVSVVDQFSGDPQYQAPTLLASAKILFKNGIAPESIGKTIDNGFALRVRESATRIGEVQLKTRGR